MNRSQFIHALVRSLPVILILACAQQIHAEDLRTWSDATGDFQLEAKFVSKTATTVKLEQKDGEAFEIPISKLSKADQDFLKKLDANPFKKSKKNPFKKTPGKNTTSSPTGSSPAPKQIKVSMARARLVLLRPKSSEWNYTAAADPNTDFDPKPVALPKKADFFDKLHGMIVNPKAKRALIGYISGSPRDKQKTARLILSDLDKGDVIADITQPGEMAPLALHDDGQRVLMCSRIFGFGKSNKLEIWSINNDKITRDLAWTAYAEESWAPNRDVLWGEFLNNEELITVSKGGKVIIWDLNPVRPISQFKIEGSSIPALSHDKNTIAFAVENQVGLFDLKTRKVIAMQNTPGKLSSPNFAFSPSGKKLACTAGGRVLVWNAESGELTQDFKPAGVSLNGKLQFPDENFILAANSYLIDIQNQIKLWQYQGAEHSKTIAGKTFFAIASHNAPGALVSSPLPHAAARDMLDKAVNRPDLFVFKEGTAVKLDISGIPGQNKKRVREALTAKLTEMNCTLVKDSPVHVIARVAPPKTKKVTYRRSGTYNVTEHIAILEFKYQNKSAWSSSNNNIPHFVRIKQGENLGDVLRKKSQGPEYGFFDRLTLPRFLQNPTAGTGTKSSQTLGSSRITSNGFQ